MYRTVVLPSDTVTVLLPQNQKERIILTKRNKYNLNSHIIMYPILRLSLNMWEARGIHYDLYNIRLCEYIMHTWARAALLLLERFLQSHVIISQERKNEGRKAVCWRPITHSEGKLNIGKCSKRRTSFLFTSFSIFVNRL